MSAPDDSSRSEYGVNGKLDLVFGSARLTSLFRSSASCKCQYLSFVVLRARGDRSGMRPDFVEKVERILARLDASTEPNDMDAPGFGLHALSGDLKGFWSVIVSRNWRMIFRFEAGDARDVNFVDYH